MTTYSVVLFLHLLGVLAIMAADAMLVAGLVQMRRADTIEQVRGGLGIARISERIMPPATLFLLLAGAYLTRDSWSASTDWIIVSFAGLVAIAMLGRLGVGKELTAIHAEAVNFASGPISPELDRLRRSPRLWLPAQIAIALFIGVVFIMTTKPGYAGSLITLGIAVIVGAIPALMGRSAPPLPTAPQPVPAPRRGSSGK